MPERAKARTKVSPDPSVAVERIFEFTLILDVDDLTDEMADRLYKAGCDDASLARSGGKTKAMFDRAASSYLDAVTSAVRDVRSAGYQVARVEADEMVTQADIARKVGKTRQAVNLYIAGTRGPGGFPSPETRASGVNSLWRWSEVAAWLKRNMLASESMADEAAIVEKANILLKYDEQRRAEPDLFDVMAVKMFGREPSRAAQPKRPKTEHESRRTAKKTGMQPA
jgi:hypothetical protein